MEEQQLKSNSNKLAILALSLFVASGILMAPPENFDSKINDSTRNVFAIIFYSTFFISLVSLIGSIKMILIKKVSVLNYFSLVVSSAIIIFFFFLAWLTIFGSV